MADDRGKDRPSLAPPSLAPPSLLRRRRKKEADPARAAGPATEPAPEPAVDPEVDAPVDPVSAVPVAGPEPDAEPEPEVEVEAEPEPAVAMVAEPRRGPVILADAPVTAVPPPPPAQPPPPPPPLADAHESPGLHGELERVPRQPWLTGRLAAVVTGLVVGILVVLATAAGGRLCSAVRGTSSCGGSGFFLLLAILGAAVLVGAAMLRAAQEPGPGSTSFLAVGLLSVLTLLFLVGSIFQWWMIIAIPLFSMASFALSHWVTTAVTGSAD